MNATLPDWTISDNLAAWFFVASSRELPEGGVLPARLGRREIVLYRAAQKVSALDAHCAHMGARLAGGRVEGEHLVCPLHGWRYGADGQVAGGRHCVRGWPVVESHGAILVFNGSQPLFAPPPELPQFHWSTGITSSLIEAPWYALTANAFDTHHYEAVHQRRLLEPPRVERPDAYRFVCSYLSQPTGNELSDRLMSWLSGGRIAVQMECYGGPLFLVRSRLSKRQSALLVGMQATPEGGTRLRLAVGSPGRGPTRALTSYLYTAFLKRDLQAMVGIKLRPYTGLAVDAIIEQFARYLEGLPEGP